jgi:hypothetical protein
MRQYDVQGRPPNVLLQLEAAAHGRGFGRVGVLGAGENDRYFEGRTGCLASFFMSTKEYVKVTAAEQDENTTRLLVSANRARNERVFDDLIAQELATAAPLPEREPCWKCGSPTSFADVRCPSCSAWLRPQS